jgi:hypothetical protein
VAETADAALRHGATTIIHSDASSNNATLNAFVGTNIQARKRSLYNKHAGKGRQVISALRAVSELPNVILILDTDNREPKESIYRDLYARIVNGSDFAIVNYRRHWFEGNLTNHIARLLVFANTGLDIPQPISGEIAISRRHAQTVLRLQLGLSEGLAKAVDGYGIDAFFLLSCTSTSGLVSTIDTHVPKKHAPSFPHLPRIFSDSVPVLCLPALRKLPMSSAGWSGRFELHEPEDTPDISKMILDLERLGARDIAESLPEKLASVWHWCDTDQAALNAVDELWVDYLSWVRHYLQIGQKEGIASAERLLVSAAVTFSHKLALLRGSL